MSREPAVRGFGATGAAASSPKSPEGAANAFSKPGLGVGVGLRSVHYDRVLAGRPEVPWFEATTENYLGLRGGAGGRACAPTETVGTDPAIHGQERTGLGAGGRPGEVLERVRRDAPVALHGVSLNIGSADPLDEAYLIQVKALADRIEPLFVSDHLCWTGVGGKNLHDLLPLPYTEECLRHVVSRVRRVQDALGRRILLENVSSYLTFAHSEMTEWEFLSDVARRADCGILLDVNNIYVSAANQGFDPRRYLGGIPAARVGYIHLAGYSDADGFFIDTHDHPVSEPVWELYADALDRFGDVPTLIEWDEKIPPFERLLAEAARAEKIRREHLPRHPRAAQVSTDNGHLRSLRGGREAPPREAGGRGTKTQGFPTFLGGAGGARWTAKPSLDTTIR